MRDSHPSEESVMTRDDIIKQALEALEIGYTSAKAEADQFHAAMAGYRPHRHAQMDADVQKIARAITALRAALEQQEQEPVAMLWKVRKALALASAICDRVPNRWHHTHEIGSAEADIGDMVNAHPDGTHGYRLIQEAEAELVAYLTTPEAAPPRREWRSLSEDEIRTAYGNDLKYRDGDYERFARAIEAALKEKNNG